MAIPHGTQEVIGIDSSNWRTAVRLDFLQVIKILLASCTSKICSTSGMAIVLSMATALSISGIQRCRDS